MTVRHGRNVGISMVTSPSKAITTPLGGSGEKMAFGLFGVGVCLLACLIDSSQQGKKPIQ